MAIFYNDNFFQWRILLWRFLFFNYNFYNDEFYNDECLQRGILQWRFLQSWPFLQWRRLKWRLLEWRQFLKWRFLQCRISKWGISIMLIFTMTSVYNGEFYKHHDNLIICLQKAQKGKHDGIWCWDSLRQTPSPLNDAPTSFSPLETPP